MTNEHLTEELSHPHPDIAMSLRIVIDQTLHEFDRQERAFWALMYAKSEFNKIDDPKHEWMDYEIAADETINAQQQKEPNNPSNIGPDIGGEE
jgi:hypothetical protein